MPFDRHRYPPDWFTTIRPAILARAGNRCEFCGLENGAVGYRWAGHFLPVPPDQVEHYRTREKLFRIVLTIAHHPDPDPLNVDPANLHALCQACHLRLDAQMHAEHAAVTRRAKRHAGQLTLDLTC
jgi:hypothetical protein